ncbi:MAG TPA: SAF domain-containing protein [Acidimicrobiales bacterium]
MTRSATDGVATEETDAADARAGPEGPAPARRRRVERLRELPSSRAIVGGLLVAVAGAGTLLAWQEASGRPARSYVVAARAIVPGETLTADDVRLAAVDLPGGVAAAAFPDADGVVDRVALGPIGEGELIQAGQLSDPGAGPPTVEVALALERDRAVDGRLRSGDLVDVFATYDDRTEAVAERVRVVGVSDGGDGAFAAGAQITVTLALTDATWRAPVIHAARVGEVTLVRSTHGPEPPGSAGSPPPAAADREAGLPTSPPSVGSPSTPGAAPPPGGDG